MSRDKIRNELKELKEEFRNGLLDEQEYLEERQRLIESWQQIRSDEPRSEPVEILGQYRLNRVLGEGGFGRVYLATHMRHGGVCALKVLLPRFSHSTEAQRRFAQELRLTQELTHPGIVRTYDLQEDPITEKSFYTMEYIEGDSLEERLQDAKESGRYPLFELSLVVDWVSQIADALDYAHSKGVIHRDVKPSNVMFQRGTLKLMDFGLAKVLSDTHLTRHTGGLGTLAYCSPEQFEGGKYVTPASDVYSLAVMTYEVLTGRLPSGRLRGYPDPPPSQLCDGLPNQVDTVVLKGMEGKATQRIKTPGEFSQALINASFPKKSSVISVNAPRLWDRVRDAIDLNRPVWLAEKLPRNETLSEAPGPNSGGCLPLRLPRSPSGVERKVILARDGSPLIEMLKIPSGAFLMGSNEVNSGGAFPQTEIYMDAYWIASTPVTEKMWHKFLQESNYRPSKEDDDLPSDYLIHWRGNSTPPKGRLHHPIVNVGYYNMWAFCDFYGLMLPSEAQWEKAARGTDGQLWPWGNQEPNESHCDLEAEETVPVGKFREGMSPYGLLDCVGRFVNERCADSWHPEPLADEQIHPGIKNLIWTTEEPALFYTIKRIATCETRGAVPSFHCEGISFRPALPDV